MTHFLFEKISTMLASKRIYLTRSLTYQYVSKKILPPNFDYIRYATLELCYEQIISNNISGSVAEVGVYKGDFSKRLNLLFKERALYLFDTFEGFAKSDIELEKEKSYSDGDQDFSDTSIELVKSKMPYPQNCIFKKGFFPETATGISDTFCL